MIKAHIVNHTHWDREWYFTAMDALVLSEQLFTDAIAELEKNPEASFVLDGQLSILDDYLALYPEKLSNIQALIAKKQLFIGPWFTQSDAFYAHAESILRNGMIGVFESKKYGEYMDIGYLPDTFGFNAQMPAILEQLGLDTFIFWRGIHLGKHVSRPYFKWQGLNGKSEVYAVNMPQGYGTGMLLEPTKEFVEGRLDPAIEFIQQFGDNREVLIPSGNDQLAIIKDFSEKITKINTIGKYTYELSTYADFLEYVKALPDLETYQGEFRSPVLARVHKTIGSSRMDIKLKSAQLEAKLLYRIEPLLVIAKKAGIHISERLLMTAWKKVLEGAAHDSLGGCVSDTVAEDILHRFKEAEEIADSIENTISKKLAEALGLSNQEILLFNTALTTFEGTKEVQVISPTKQISFPDHPEAVIVETDYVEARENVLFETPAGNEYIEEPGYYLLRIQLPVKLPGLSYQVVSFHSTTQELPSMEQKPTAQISNDFITVSFENGVLTAETAFGKRIEQFLSFVDEANAGDTYDFSPLVGDTPVKLTFQTAEISTAKGVQKMKLTGSYTLPYDLENRLLTPHKEGVLKLTATLTLKTGDPLLHGELHIKNSLRSHRLRLLVETGIETDHNHASLPFGFIKRTKGVPADWEATYSEMPIDIEPLEQNISVSDEEAVCSVFTKGIKEYQHQGTALALTLLATTDQLGKPDLVYRPGRASGDTTKRGHILMATEKAQLMGDWNYDFAISFAQGAFSEKNTAQLGKYFAAENVDYLRQDYNYFLHRLDNKIQSTGQQLTVPQTLSVISLPEDILVSACHPSYYKQAQYLIRIENPTGKAIEIPTILQQAEQINALEEIQEAKRNVPAYSALTFRLPL